MPIVHLPPSIAHKASNATNSLCGYKIVTGQPSDRLGEDFTELFKDFNERLSTIEVSTRAMLKKLTQGMTEHKEMAAAKTDEEKILLKYRNRMLLLVSVVATIYWQ